MPQLFIIAAPPEIGKSTIGKKFISTNIGILNHDAFFIYYRARGEVDYEDLSNLKADNFIQQKLSNKLILVLK